MSDKDKILTETVIHPVCREAVLREIERWLEGLPSNETSFGVYKQFLARFRKPT